jgi:hypothetical protein
LKMQKYLKHLGSKFEKKRAREAINYDSVSKLDLSKVQQDMLVSSKPSLILLNI